MTRKNVWTIGVLVAALFLLPRGARAAESCTTAQCHAKLVQGKTVHPATDSCDSCHESVATPHPQKGKKTFKLTAQPPELCANCHDPFGKKAVVHPPVKDGECTTCHDPHSSDQAKLLTAPQLELCGGCHSDHVEFKFVHGPVSSGECTACHTPHESDAKKLLKKTGDELCFGCHGDIQSALQKKDVHPAVEMGCTSCHNPHGAANPKLLAEAGAQLCFTCHDAIQDQVQKAVVKHPPVVSAKGCASCHSPHATDNPKLLLAPEKDICLTCHKNVIPPGAKFLHGPIAEGKCTACHTPHGGQYPKLLKDEFPATPYVPYTDKEFALCFTCHKRDLVQYPDTSFATNFRDGERNLHYLHVNNAQKGRSCALCHNLHAGNNPALIADSVPFGQWQLPLKFVKTETGGSCAPGCHKPQSYDRKTPAKKPEPAKPPAAPQPTKPSAATH